MELLEIPISRIHPARNPRRKFDAATLETLTESIRQFGVLTPVTVCPDTRAPEGEAWYLLLAGERRLRAATAAGLESLPALVRPMSAFVGLVENLQRVDLTPLEEARAFKEMSEISPRDGIKPFTVTEIARAIGRSQPYVSNRIRLLQLPEEVIGMIEREELTAAHGVALLRLSEWPDALMGRAEIAFANGINSRTLDDMCALDVGKLAARKNAELQRVGHWPPRAENPPPAAPAQAQETETAESALTEGDAVSVAPEPAQVFSGFVDSVQAADAEVVAAIMDQFKTGVPLVAPQDAEFVLDAHNMLRTGKSNVALTPPAEGNPPSSMPEPYTPSPAMQAQIDARKPAYLGSTLTEAFHKAANREADTPITAGAQDHLSAFMADAPDPAVGIALGAGGKDDVIPVRVHTVQGSGLYDRPEMVMRAIPLELERNLEHYDLDVVDALRLALELMRIASERNTSPLGLLSQLDVRKGASILRVMKCPLCAGVGWMMEGEHRMPCRQCNGLCVVAEGVTE